MSLSKTQSSPEEALLDKNEVDSLDSEYSKGTDLSDDFAVAARRRNRRNKKQYKYFIRENKSFWMWFNLITVFLSLAFIIGTYFILDSNPSNCASLRFILYATIFLHGMNMIIALINLTGKETKICTSNCVCVFSIIEVVLLIWMNVAYFDAQVKGCIGPEPVLYFWLMAQILTLYIGLAIVVCHMFRKFCQDPADGDDY